MQMHRQLQLLEAPGARALDHRVNLSITNQNARAVPDAPLGPGLLNAPYGAVSGIAQVGLVFERYGSARNIDDITQIKTHGTPSTYATTL
jgi:hypothetical protein